MDPVRVKRHAGRIQLVFDVVVDISRAHALYARLSKLLQQKNTNIVLDAGRVERIDTAILQMLVVFCRAAEARGIHVAWGETSPQVEQTINLLGVAPLLGKAA